MNPQIANIKRYAKELRLLYILQNIDLQAPDAKARLGQLETLQFIENKQNIILAGRPGTGNYRKYSVIERNESIR